MVTIYGSQADGSSNPHGPYVKTAGIASDAEILQHLNKETIPEPNILTAAS